MHRLIRALCFVFGLVAATGGVVGAQNPTDGLATRGPRFLMKSPSGVPVPVEVNRTAVLLRRITVDLKGATLGQALATIGRESGLRLVYSTTVVPLDRTVRLKAEDITVAAALTEVLVDLGVDVMFSSRGQAVLVRRGEAGNAAVAGGTIVGRVTDGKSGEGIAGAEVALEGTRWRATTGADGRYRLSDVAPGTYTLAVRRIGYGRMSQAVVVASEQEVTIEVALQPVATQLNEIVTTVTGDQRRVELGHVVGRINADSLAKEAPVTSLSELLSGRVPGLQVLQESGTVGGRVNVRIRGPNSLVHDNQPIVIVDGVRYTTQEKTPLLLVSSVANVEPTSPLNDLNVNDIESIEVVKGPSAATLYGTDAANGVLVITTKRGRPGRTRWGAYAKSSLTETPAPEVPPIYWGWGTVSGVPNHPFLSCTIERLTNGQCTRQDSVTVRSSPFTDPELTLFTSRPRWEYGLDLAGGQQALRYRFAANLEDAAGTVQMPRALAEQLRQQRGLRELPEAWREPNAQSKVNLLSNVTAVPGERGDVALRLGYTRSNTRTLSTTFNGYARGFSTPDYNQGSNNPDQLLQQTTNERVDRFVGGVAGTWRPAGWLSARAALGLDLTGAHRTGFISRGDQSPTSPGEAIDDRWRQVTTTADLGARATARFGRLSAATALGLQYVRSLNDGFSAVGSELPRGWETPAFATVINIAHRYTERVGLGGYVEEVLGLNERLFLTGALRLDGSSTFGKAYEAAAYPKAGASWLLSEEPFVPRLPGLTELRLRYAYGASGTSPTPFMASPLLGAGTALVGGQLRNVVGVARLGNPELRPERVREHEFGLDARALGDRLTAELTWYRRRTVDQHIDEAGPPGRGTMTTNLGLTTQRGFEAQLRARVLESRALSWDLTLQHSAYTTLLVDAGEGFPERSRLGGYVEGYPLGARFLRPYRGYTDVNGDGLIDPRIELQFGDTLVYMGQSLPPRTQTLTSVLALAEGKVRLSVLLERKAGFTQINPYRCIALSCRAGVDPSTPLAEQAEAMLSPLQLQMPERGDFTRLREVTLALELPTGLLRALPFRRGTLVLSARNLALWSAFSGPDPEVGGGSGTFTELSPVAGGAAAGLPLPRTFSLRLDLGT